MVKWYALPQSTLVYERHPGGRFPALLPAPAALVSPCPVRNRVDRYTEPAPWGFSTVLMVARPVHTYYGLRGLMNTHERRATESAPRSFVSSAIFCASITSPAMRLPPGAKHHLQTCRPAALSSSMLVWVP